jgi:hypothetical protein
LRREMDQGFVWDEFWIRGPWSIFKTALGRVDVLVSLPGIDSFEGLYSRSELIDLEGVAVRVACLDDLISMKQASDRPKDKIHLMELLAIKKEQEG